MKARKISCRMALVLFGLVAACSDAVPPAAQAAASFHLAGAATGSTCPQQPHWSNIPYIPATQSTQQVTFDAKGPAADHNGPLGIDGEGGVRVTCSVKANGGKFDVIATATTPVPGLPNATLFTAITTLGVDEVGASGSVSVSDDKTGGILYTSNACQFQARPTTAGAPGIGPGKVWASVTCTNLVDPRSSDATATCSLAPASVFVFENCDQ
jgi:hypothetical protein